MWRDSTRGLHSSFLTPTTLWSNVCRLYEETRQKRTRTCTHWRKTSIHLKNTHTYPSRIHTNTHTQHSCCSPSCSHNEGLFFPKKKSCLSSHLAPPCTIISGHHCRRRRIVVFKHNLSSPDTFMFCRAYSNCRFCAQPPPFTGQAHNGLPHRGPYLWKGPPTLHTIQPLYSQFMVKDPPALNASCVHHYLSVFMCFENNNHSHLSCVMHGGIMMRGPQTGNDLELFFFSVCASLFLCVAVCVLGVCVCVCMYEIIVLIAVRKLVSAKGSPQIEAV